MPMLLPFHSQSLLEITNVLWYDKLLILCRLRQPLPGKILLPDIRKTKVEKLANAPVVFLILVLAICLKLVKYTFDIFRF